ncbi:MAG: precorrin-6A reductase [Atribacterota bacterium]
MILVLGGTTEGRAIAQKLWERGYPVWVSVVYAFGRGFIPNGIPVRVGPFSAEGLRHFVYEKDVRLIIDATHPFAGEIKDIARKVSSDLGIPHLVYERPRVELPSSVIQVENCDEALRVLAPYRKIFLTVGSKYLAPFVRLKKEGKSIRVRVLPVSRSLRYCERLGLTPKEVVAILGPVSTELNRVLFQEFGAEVVVSKESGQEGGLLEKIEAADALGIPLVLIKRRRRQYGEVFHDFDALFTRLGELYGS